MAKPWPKPDPSPDDLLPLPSATFHILVALSDADRHGYAIMQEVAERTEGRAKLNLARSTPRSIASSNRA